MAFKSSLPQWHPAYQTSAPGILFKIARYPVYQRGVLFCCCRCLFLFCCCCCVVVCVVCVFVVVVLLCVGLFVCFLFFVFVCFFLGGWGVTLIYNYIYIYFIYLYNELRKQYIPSFYRKNPSMQKCIQLLSIENPSLLRKLGCYVHKAFDIRTSSICVNI